MAQNRLGGPGIGLPYPQSLYPTSLIGAAPQAATNVLTLANGEALPIPPGDWLISGAPMQWLDPVTGTWIYIGSSSAVNEGYVHSDGQNMRVINPNGIVTAATVTAAGSAYTTAPTVTPSAGGSTYTAIVGGAVSLTLPGGGGGSGYTVAPIVLISAPPAGGIQATATATVSSGAVTGYTVVNAGAGYTTAPTVQVLPNPYDPNYGSIVNASVTAALTGSGTITGVLCTWGGTPLGTQPTLSFSTGSATATTVWLITSGTPLTVYMQPL